MVNKVVSQVVIKVFTKCLYGILIMISTFAQSQITVGLGNVGVNKFRRSTVLGGFHFRKTTFSVG